MLGRNKGVYLCICVYNVFINVYIYIIYIHKFVLIYTCVCMYLYVSRCSGGRDRCLVAKKVHTYICVYKRVCIYCVYTHICIDTYIYVYIYIYNSPLLWRVSPMLGRKQGVYLYMCL